MNVFSIRVFLLCLVSFSAQALDLLQAYELALVNDETTHAAEFKAEAGREAIPQAVSQMLPNVSFNSNDSYVQQNRSSNGVNIPQQNYPALSHTVSIRQPLFRLGLWATYDEAKANVANAEATLGEAYQDLGTRVAQAYYQLLLSKERLKLVIFQKNHDESLWKSAVATFNAGFGVRTDIDAYKASFDKSYAKEIELRQLIDYNAQQLKFFIGTNVDSIAELNIEKFKPEVFPVGNYNEWLETAIANNNNLTALKSRLEALDARVFGAKAKHFPTVDLIAQYAKSESDNSYFSGTSLDSRSVGVQINVPIFSGGAVNSSIREAESLREESRHQYLSSLNQLTLEVHKHHSAVKQGIEEIHALEQALKSDEQLVVSTHKSIIAGTRSVLDVLVAEQQKIDTAVALAEARYGFLLAWISLHASTGRINKDFMATVNQYFN